MKRMILAAVAYLAVAQNPALGFSTYIGGSSDDSIRDIEVDAQGNAYITGGTTSPNFPVTAGAYDTTYNTGGSPLHDVYVTKLSPNGQILWSTYLGGPNYDRAYAIEVDGQGNVYVAGRAGQGFPVTPGAFQTQFSGSPTGGAYGSQDGFIAKLSPDGSQLLWASYFGTTDPQIIRDIDVDVNGDVLVGSSYSSGVIPTSIANGLSSGVHPTPRGSNDGLLAKVSADGRRVLWATFVGGSGQEVGTPSVRLDSQGNAIMVIMTASTNARTTPDAFDRTHNGANDFYLFKVRADGRLMMAATFLGGNGGDGLETHELAIGPDDTIYVSSGSSSTNFPVLPGAFQTGYGGSGGAGTGQGTNYWGDICIARLDPMCRGLLGCTYLGGRYGESCEGVEVDPQGNVYLTGATYSDNFPVSLNAYQPQLRGVVGNNNSDALVARLGPGFSSAGAYVTYIGGTAPDVCRAAALGPDGAMWIAGASSSNDWPLVNPIQNSRAGGYDGVISVFRMQP